MSEEQTRWDKVKELVEDILEDDQLRLLYQNGPDESKIADLETRGLYPDDYSEILNDLEDLEPDINPRIIWMWIIRPIIPPEG